MRKAMTLIEVLLSLVILSAVVSATAVWTQIAGQIGTSQLARQHWDSAAANVLQLVHDDLACCDVTLAAKGSSSSPPSPRAAIVDGMLTIETRWPGLGAVTHQYHLDQSSNHLALIEAKGNTKRTRPLLDSVQAFDCQLNQTQTVLDVSIVRLGKLESASTGVGTNSDDSVSRRYGIQ